MDRRGHVPRKAEKNSGQDARSAQGESTGGAMEQQTTLLQQGSPWRVAVAARRAPEAPRAKRTTRENREEEDCAARVVCAVWWPQGPVAFRRVSADACVAFRLALVPGGPGHWQVQPGPGDSVSISAALIWRANPPFPSDTAPWRPPRPTWRHRRGGLCAARSADMGGWKPLPFSIKWLQQACPDPDPSSTSVNSRGFSVSTRWDSILSRAGVLRRVGVRVFSLS